MTASEKLNAVLETLVGFFDESPVKGTANILNVGSCLMSLKEVAGEVAELEAGQSKESGGTPADKGEA